MIFELEITFWKRHWFSSLDPCDLLNLLQTCRFFQKHKMYLYKLIFIGINRKAESIVSCNVPYDLVLDSKIKISEDTISDINILLNESAVELIKIVKIFLSNPELNKFIMRRSNSLPSRDLRFAMLFKKYFITQNEGCFDAYKKVIRRDLQMDRFLNFVFYNRTITYI